MTTNSKLITLYADKYKDLAPVLIKTNNCILDEKNKATNPLLLRVDQSWENSRLKVMIFGQETNKWGWRQEVDGSTNLFEYNLNSIEHLLQLYYDFFFIRNGIYSPFWQFFNSIKKYLQDRCDASVVWNNINKIGILEAGCSSQIYDITKSFFNIVKDEIDILKPDIIIFLTGPRYDDKIKDSLGPFNKKNIEDFNPNQMCSIEFESNYGFSKVLRTYHPAYLRRQMLTDTYINQVFRELDYAIKLL